MSGKPKVLSIDEVQRRRDQPEDQHWPWSPSKPIESVDEAHQWREHAEAGHWWLVAETFLAREDREELLKLLTAKVPTSMQGEGLKAHLDFIHPIEAATAEEADAARLARTLKRWKASEEQSSVPEWMRPFTDPFVEHVQAAQDILREHKIQYEGLASTFLYWSRAENGWKQIPSKRAKLVKERSSELNSFKPNSFEPDRERRKKKLQDWQHWHNRYPWRSCSTLQQFMKDEYIRPFSGVWYACKILEDYERTLFSKCVQTSSPSRPSNPTISETAPYTFAHMCDAYQVGLRIGASNEALKNKSFEPDAIRGIDQLKNASEGGKERGRRYEAEKKKLVSGIQERIDDGKTVSAALRLVAAANLKARVFNQSNQTHGKEFSRIRGVWYRHRKKL